MLRIRFQLTLRRVENLTLMSGVEVSGETLCYLWKSFGPLVATEFHGKRVDRMSQYRKWKWHLDGT